MFYSDDLLIITYAFRCLCCPKSFARKDHLRNHVRRHVFIKDITNLTKKIESKDSNLTNDQIQQYSCKHCDKKSFFKSLTRYISHLEEFHTDVNGYACPSCDECLESPKILRNHVEESHATVKVKQEAQNDDIGMYRTMPSADSCFQKSSLVSRDLCFYFKKRPLYCL